MQDLVSWFVVVVLSWFCCVVCLVCVLRGVGAVDPVHHDSLPLSKLTSRGSLFFLRLETMPQSTVETNLALES